jgi:hypothetical protein
MADGRISRLDRFSYDGVHWLPADQIPELMERAAAATPATADAQAGVDRSIPVQCRSITTGSLA